MATQYIDLLKQIIGDIGDVNPNQVELVFQRCLKSFVERSQVWRTRWLTDLAAATPDPVTRESLMVAYQAAQHAANADPSDLALAQAAADARAAAYAKPEWTLTRLVKTPAVIDPPTPVVYYNAVAYGLRVEYRGQNAYPYWRINAPTVACGNQTLDVLPPIAHLPNGSLLVRLYWVPFFDSDTSLACPDWIYERYGDIVSEWTVGELWVKGRGRRADRQLGLNMRNNAMIDADKVRARVNAEDPIPIAM